MVSLKNILLISLIATYCFSACKPATEKLAPSVIVEDPASINQVVAGEIQRALLLAIDQQGVISDSLQIYCSDLLEETYYRNDYLPFWSDTGFFRPVTSQLIGYLDTVYYDGLFQNDYHYSDIKRITRLLKTDSLKKTDAALWTKADLLLTDAFMRVALHLKQGRLKPDSSSWLADSTKYSSFFIPRFNRLFKNEDLATIITGMHPGHEGYLQLRSLVRPFVDSMDTKAYTYVRYPFIEGNEKDSLRFIGELQVRLSESDFLKLNPKVLPDSADLADAITKYQKKKKLTPDGKYSAALVKSLNLTDKEKYNRLAITLDRYKLLPDSMPLQYIWVNLPSYTLVLHDSDSVVLQSRIICGKPATPTPQLTSAISDLVIYPTWTVPASIIKKEMLPGLKRNPNYLARKGLGLYNADGDRIDPSTINWSKYSKGIPYKIQQGSGDNNALGVIKFNFDNPYFVYLHDTNQRYLFKNSMRALSHGCVRVQEWQQLAAFIARNDSLRLKVGDSLKYTADSITNWIANKERHRIVVKQKLPLYIRYFTCAAVEGKLKFYDDLYGDDKLLREKYFSKK